MMGRPSFVHVPKEQGFIARTGERLLGLIGHVGVITQMTLGTLRAAFRRPFEGREILTQLESLGVKSLGIVAVTSIFIGMVMAVQFAFGLRKFGGMEYTGRVVGLSFARELAPTLTAVIVGGRIGAGMAAEVGSMAVTEQIDAVRALGADPLKKLVWPRLVASVMVMPVLAAFALVLGFSGAMIDHRSAIQHPGGVLLAERARHRDDDGLRERHAQNAGVRRDHRARRLSLRNDDQGRRDSRRQQHHQNRRGDLDHDLDRGFFPDKTLHLAMAARLSVPAGRARAVVAATSARRAVCGRRLLRRSRAAATTGRHRDTPSTIQDAA